MMIRTTTKMITKIINKKSESHRMGESRDGILGLGMSCSTCTPGMVSSTPTSTCLTATLSVLELTSGLTSDGASLDRSGWEDKGGSVTIPHRISWTSAVANPYPSP